MIVHGKRGVTVDTGLPAGALLRHCGMFWVNLQNCCVVGNPAP
jgi:plasmid maintenance system antidote protein VapI